ncbi:hypothetical protein RSOLAG1IB_08693 [Rhizoctonia solani AG-1 IB]|uniref:Uncharacterized protein n=1 Tax=Thanatephorus cucumeris (strain AG1-IB / isolate 7/3/14) TaxID=1108050 RepID=A0A0B7FL08_THACB|nr:hypothetical protein RSOLAG1IB_08693 [Rhizoctonia solani AG-1 IB]
MFKSIGSLLRLEDLIASDVPLILKVIKWVGFVVLVLNFKSFPGVWHILMPLLKHRLSGLLNRRGGGSEWWTSVSPVGRSVFPTPDGSDKGALVVLECRATLDDCDWIGHLSNSSYAKNLDPARMRMLLSWFPAFFDDGGMAALGAAHYQYIKEIRMNAKYEIRLSIGAWEDKWVYCVAKFVSHTKQKSTSKSQRSDSSSTQTPFIPSVSTLPTPSVSTLPTPSVTEAPTPAELVASKSQDKTVFDTSIVDKALFSVEEKKQVLQTHDTDGALIHCIAVSAICFKHGRITVPPNIVLATSGYSLTEPGDTNNWLCARRLRERGRVAMSEFFRGGWKSEDNKFWEVVPKVETERIKRLAELKKLTEGMNGLRV